MPTTLPLADFLQEKAEFYNCRAFIEKDPISVPHAFTLAQDREIAGFFAAILAWGNRTTIIANALRLMQWMDDKPHEFVLHHKPSDLRPFLGFAHRTFNTTDLLYTLSFLQQHYLEHDSLQQAFAPGATYSYPTVEQALIHFHNYFFSDPDHPDRTRKHIPTPLRRSACKRLNMYLRWMVRRDKKGVDFGIWNTIAPSQLILPLDVHVASVAVRLGLLPDARSTWDNADLLTARLRLIDPVDPARFDFALFGLGMAERM